MTEITPQERADIQGIVLSGYGHLYYTAYLFLRIEDRARTKTWLKEVIAHVTSAAPWSKNSDGTTDKPDATLNIAFTHSGLQALGLQDKALNTFPREFTEGMIDSKRSEILGDTGESAPDQWNLGGTNNPDIHIILMLHGINSEKLGEFRNEILDSQESGTSISSQEYGYRVPTKKEHFGFNDSISQPEIEGLRPEQDPNNTVASGEILLGYPDGYGIWPLTPVIPKADDQHGILAGFPEREIPDYKDLGRNGTFMVYRKLVQDVAGFWQYIDQKTRDENGQPDPDKMTLIASKFVGRWPSGTPLTLAPEQDDLTIKDKNTFTYLPNDNQGFGCPLGAHIRRTNPRDSLIDSPGEDSVVTSSRHRILRRGSLFGAPLFPLDDIEEGNLPLEIQDDGQQRGLHFFCMNTDIGRQFEFLQQSWANNSRFNGLYDNKDPLIGDNDGTGHMTIPQCPVRQRIQGIPRFVTVKGGAYFFLPSMRSLQFLAQ